jgi:tetratricopeptide (TPR) repeat protein
MHRRSLIHAFLSLALAFCWLPLEARKKVKLEERERLTSSQSAKLSLHSLYNTLDPLSISQHLAFYELYPDAPEGKMALKRAWELLGGGTIPSHLAHAILPQFELRGMIALVNRQPFDPPVKLTEDQLNLIHKMASRLRNRELQGSHVWSKEEVLALESEEIDLARGLLVDQFEGSPHLKEEVRQYEASLDLMALQILARLSPETSDEEKIRVINQFVFHEMQFRFPPHSIYAKEIDLYTFLPSVIDSRQGVCLGVSILYLSLGQRLGLPLEIITPPGHIYVRYRKNDQIINIETTARGIHMPSDVYLGIDTRKLHQRTLKETIGLAFMNQAAVLWTNNDHSTAVALYEKALPYLKDDPLLKMFLGINYLSIGKMKQGINLFKEIKGMTFDEAVSAETIPADYLNGKVDIDGINAVFSPVDETRESIVKKQKELEKIVARYPSYRAGILQLAITWLQLGRGTEALEILQRYHKVDPHNATVEYYLSIIAAGRFNYPLAWSHLLQAETLVHARDHRPKALLNLRNQLRSICPEP